MGISGLLDYSRLLSDVLFLKLYCGEIGGTIVLFDRKMLRNFRKDGHNWKKKKDGKTVKEAHEHLKVWFLLAFIMPSTEAKVSKCILL